MNERDKIIEKIVIEHIEEEGYKYEELDISNSESIFHELRNFAYKLLEKLEGIETEVIEETKVKRSYTKKPKTKKQSKAAYDLTLRSSNKKIRKERKPKFTKEIEDYISQDNEQHPSPKLREMIHTRFGVFISNSAIKARRRKTKASTLKPNNKKVTTKEAFEKEKQKMEKDALNEKYT